MGVDAVFAELGLSERPAGVLWDMDGTIVDTEPEWLAASINVVEQGGGEWLAEDGEAILGASAIDHANVLARAITRTTGKEADQWELVGTVVRDVESRMRQGFTLMPGAMELLRAFHEAGIPQALVTASSRVLVEALFDGIDGNLLSEAVTGDDEIPGKPDPAPYLLGAQRLGVPIEKCLAFEDSKPGLAAARGAGAHTIPVTQTPLAGLAKLL